MDKEGILGGMVLGCLNFFEHRDLYYGTPNHEG